MPVQPRSRFTLQEYFQRERDSMEKHEYRNGEIIAMAGGSARNSLVIANLIGALWTQLQGKPCRVYESNLRVRIARKVLYTYPDLSVVCGALYFDADDTSQHTILNPRVIIEVLSESTEAYDRGEKFMRYREIDSLEEYVLVSQHAPRVETFSRQKDDRWLLQTFEGLDQSVRIGSIELSLPLTQVFAGVELPEIKD